MLGCAVVLQGALYEIQLPSLGHCQGGLNIPKCCVWLYNPPTWPGTVAFSRRACYSRPLQQHILYHHWQVLEEGAMFDIYQEYGLLVLGSALPHWRQDGDVSLKVEGSANRHIFQYISRLDMGLTDGVRVFLKALWCGYPQSLDRLCSQERTMVQGFNAGCNSVVYCPLPSPVLTWPLRACPSFSLWTHWLPQPLTGVDAAQSPFGGVVLYQEGMEFVVLMSGHGCCIRTLQE